MREGGGREGEGGGRFIGGGEINKQGMQKLQTIFKFANLNKEIDFPKMWQHIS